MDEEKLKQLTDGINKSVDDLNSSIEKQQETLDTYEKSIEEIRESLKNVADKEYTEKIQTQLDSVEDKIDKLAIETGDAQPVEKQIDEFFKTELYKNASKEAGHEGTFRVKATITTSNSFTETNAPIVAHMREPGITVDPRNPFILTQLFAKGTTSSDAIDWVERSDETVGTTAVAEAGTFGASDVSWTSYTVPVKKIGGYAKVSREKLEDTDFVRGEIMEALGYQAPHMLEYYLWNGSGSSNQIYGILGSGTYNQAPTFSLPTGVAAVTSPNEYDVLAAAILMVELGANSATAIGFNPNAIIVHPTDWFNMTRLKDTTNQYLVGMDGIMRVNGVPVYKSNRITAGTYLVGDFTKGKIYMRRNTEIRMWEQNDTDPIADLVTFTVSNRAALKIAHATTGLNRRAFVTGTFTAGKSALTA